MRRTIVVLWLAAFGMQSVPFYDLQVSPEVEIRAQIASLSRQLQVLIDDLKAQVKGMGSRALERAYQQRGAMRQREVWQYLPSYCPLVPDNEEAAF